MGRHSKATKTIKDVKIKEKLAVKKRTSKDDETVEENNMPSAESSKIQKRNELRSNNSSNVATEEGNKSTNISKKKKLKRDKRTEDYTNEIIPKNKKIKFDNDESEVETKIGKSKKIKCLNDDEAGVKDEDIDKFCEELDEEDNEQYENWVKLIEANFKLNKKKT